VCVVLPRAPGIKVFEYHTQSKREREKTLRLVRKIGGVCVTSYGVVVNNADELSTNSAGHDFVWVRKRHQTQYFHTPGNNTHTRLMALCPGLPGQPVPER